LHLSAVLCVVSRVGITDQFLSLSESKGKGSVGTDEIPRRVAKLGLDIENQLWLSLVTPSQRPCAALFSR
jgi:hypothetical protein